MSGMPRTASNVMARIFRNPLIEALKLRIVQIRITLFGWQVAGVFLTSRFGGLIVSSVTISLIHVCCVQA